MKLSMKSGESIWLTFEHDGQTVEGKLTLVKPALGAHKISIVLDIQGKIVMDTVERFTGVSYFLFIRKDVTP